VPHSIARHAAPVKEYERHPVSEWIHAWTTCTFISLRFEPQTAFPQIGLEPPTFMAEIALHLYAGMHARGAYRPCVWSVSLLLRMYRFQLAECCKYIPVDSVYISVRLPNAVV
jgi:hypothetical protein